MNLRKGPVSVLDYRRKAAFVGVPFRVPPACLGQMIRLGVGRDCRQPRPPCTRAQLRDQRRRVSVAPDKFAGCANVKFTKS